MKKIFVVIMICLFDLAVAFGQGVLYSQNFATGLTGTTVTDSIGGSSVWTYSHGPFNSPSDGTINFMSPTSANGFALIVSDQAANNIGTGMTLPVINCSGHSYVGLQFYQWFAYNSSATASIWVSTDNVTWTDVYDAVGNSTNMNTELVQLDISAVAANQPTVYIKFDYTAWDDLWWAVDDIYVTSQPTGNVSADLTPTTEYAPANSTLVVRAQINNNDTNILNSIVLAYSFNHGAAVSQTFTGLHIYGHWYDTVQFSVPIPLGAVGTYPLTLMISMPNGTSVPLTSTDTVTKSIITLSHIPNRNVLIEEYTGAYCGWCPGGVTRIGQIMSSADSAFAIPVCLHAFLTDDVSTPEDAILGNAFAFLGYPSAAIDREHFPFVDNSIGIGDYNLGTPLSVWKTAAENEHVAISPVSIAASNTYDSVSGLVTVTVSSTFYGPVSGNFRMNCYITEDSIVDTDPGAYQVSYYYASPTTYNPWLYVGDFTGDSTDVTIPDFVDHYVERQMMNGIWGDSCTTGKIPPTTTDGATYTQTYTATISPYWRSQFISLDAFVCEYSDILPNSQGSGTWAYYNGSNVVWNAVKMPLNSSVSSETTAIREIPSDNANMISLYPNPAKDYVTLAFSLSNDAQLSFGVYNTVGQLVLQQDASNYAKGGSSTNINTSSLDNGLYFIIVKDQGNTIQTLKFVIAR